MLRKNIYATLIVILMLGAASAQTEKKECRDILILCVRT